VRIAEIGERVDLVLRIGETDHRHAALLERELWVDVLSAIRDGDTEPDGSAALAGAALRTQDGRWMRG